VSDCYMVCAKCGGKLLDGGVSHRSGSTYTLMHWRCDRDARAAAMQMPLIITVAPVAISNDAENQK
jgi:hypothetical protein